MSILAWVLILGAAAIATAVHGLVVTGGSWIVAVLLLLILIGLVQAIRTWRSDDQLMKRIERVAMDANQGILESRITLIPSGHPYAECAWAINEMMDQTETVFRDTSTVLKRMVVGEYGWAPQPGGLKGSFPELLRTVGDVEGRVQVTMESLARVMQGLGEGDLAVRMGEEVEEVFRRQVNGAMESIEQVLSQFGTIIEGMAEGDCTHRVELDGVQGDLLKLGKDINRSLDSLSQAIIESITVSSHMGEGDLTLQVEGDYRGALGRMKESINLSQRNLAQIVANVREISSQVKVGSNSVSEGSARLADRTAEQAASLEQTAASMEEISSTVNMSADSAQLANRLAEETVGQVMKGGEVIGRAIEAMDGINESSNKIVEIIALIDGIAFQTNLLALNAAVEAARAGEHGRGFGVVAGEVRGLAQRSADAAKDIRNLIEDSTNRVESGTRLVTESGEALGTVKEGIQKINDLISEIAAAAKEQTSGVEQINQAISSLDSNTQANSAMVEETTSSSKTLTELAQQLDEMVVSFKIAADVQAELEVVKRAPNPPSRTAKRSPPTASRSRPTAPPRAPQKDGEWSDF